MLNRSGQPGDISALPARPVVVLIMTPIIQVMRGRSNQTTVSARSRRKYSRARDNVPSMTQCGAFVASVTARAEARRLRMGPAGAPNQGVQFDTMGI